MCLESYVLFRTLHQDFVPLTAVCSRFSARVLYDTINHIVILIHIAFLFRVCLCHLRVWFRAISTRGVQSRRLSGSLAATFTEKFG